MSPTPNSSRWVTARTEDPPRAAPTASSPQGQRARQPLRLIGHPLPFRPSFVFSRSAPPPSSEITDASTSQPIERAGTRARMKF